MKRILLPFVVIVIVATQAYAADVDTLRFGRILRVMLSETTLCGRFNSGG
jgi:hypothetical protein